MISQHAFGSRLRTQRERRGVALAAIAERTKLKLSLLEALERGDLSQWPKGLFRRAYLRDYAAGVGMNADALLLEVEQLFPEEGEPVRVASVQSQTEPMRLSFPSAPALTGHRVLATAGTAALEWAVVVAVGLAIGWWSGVGPLTACGALALLYYPVSIALTGRALSVPVARMALNRLVAQPKVEPEPVTEQAPLYLVNRSPATTHQQLGGTPLNPVPMGQVPLSQGALSSVPLVAVRAAEDVSAHQTAVS